MPHDIGEGGGPGVSRRGVIASAGASVAVASAPGATIEGLGAPLTLDKLLQGLPAEV